jgi:hypothetical protein
MAIPTAYMHKEDLEYSFADASSNDMYAQEIYGVESMQSYMDDQDFSYPRTSHDQFDSFSTFSSAPLYPEVSQFGNSRQSPNLSSFDFSEVRPPPSNLSTASGPSAPSSTLGSPYSNPGQTVSIPEFGSGLGIGPSIVGGAYDNYAHDYNSYPVSGMEDYAFPDMTKSNIFVGECAPVSASSSSSMSTFVPSSQLDTMDGMFDRRESNASTLRSTQSPLSAFTSASSGSDFVFKSPSTPVSSFSPVSTRRVSVFSLGNSSTAGRAQDCRSSPLFPAAQSFQPDVVEHPPYKPYHQSPFFSQTSGQFLAPLESSCLFPLSFLTPTVSSCHIRTKTNISAHRSISHPPTPNYIPNCPDTCDRRHCISVSVSISSNVTHPITPLNPKLGTPQAKPIALPSLSTIPISSPKTFIITSIDR